MNHPTEDRLKKIEERLDRIEQQTEPIKMTDTILLQTLVTMSGTHATDIAVLKHEMQGARADIISIKATQSDHGELLREHSKRFDKVEVSIAELKGDIAALKTTQDTHSKRMDTMDGKLDLILQLLQKRGE